VSKNLGWRGAIVGVLIIVAFSYLTPSLSRELPPWWSSILPQEKIQLGLDLQGGMHLVLEVEAEKAVETELERDVDNVKDDLRKGKIRYLELRRNGVEGVDVTLLRAEDRDLFEGVVKANYPDYDIEDGGQKENGLALRMILDSRTKDQIMKMATDQALETIRNRIDQFGVSEPDIRPQENHRILIQLPGIKDPERAIKLIGKTAQLEFKLVDEENSLDEALKGNMPSGREILYQDAIDPKTGSKKRSLFC